MKSMATRIIATAFLALATVGSAQAEGDAVPEGDAVRGEQVFRQCMACHTIDEGRNIVGPSLYGVFGRPAGTVEGYNYSPAMRDADVVWSAETIDQQLADPPGFVPQNRMGMMFPQGIPDSQDRADLIAYLLEATAPPAE